MSLPEYALFIKDDTVVGVGFCNIGWFFTPSRVWECMVSASTEAMNYYTPAEELAKKYNRDINFILEDRVREAKYFTTIEDLKAFEFIHLYHLKIPRYVVENMLSKKWDNDKLTLMINTKIFNAKDSREALREDYLTQ